MTNTMTMSSNTGHLFGHQNAPRWVAGVRMETPDRLEAVRVAGRKEKVIRFRCADVSFGQGGGGRRLGGGLGSVR